MILYLSSKGIDVKKEIENAMLGVNPIVICLDNHLTCYAVKICRQQIKRGQGNQQRRELIFFLSVCKFGHACRLSFVHQEALQIFNISFLT